MTSGGRGRRRRPEPPGQAPPEPPANPDPVGPPAPVPGLDPITPQPPPYEPPGRNADPAHGKYDIVKYAGGSPANFLDVGGGANAEQIRNAFRILLSDASVKAVLINIFGGILRCDTLATGVVAAAKELLRRS